jgi:LysM repeat protein
VFPHRAVRCSTLAALAAILIACRPVTDTPHSLPTFTPRSLPSASPTLAGAPFIPTLTPVPLGQLPNALITYRFDVTLDYLGHRAQVAQNVEVINPGPDTWDSLLFQLPAAVQSPAFILNSITSPSGETAVNAAYQRSGYLLRVILPAGVMAGEVAKVTLNYGLAANEINAATRPPDGSVGYNEDIIQFVNWYPVLTPYQPGSGWALVGEAAAAPLPGDPVFADAATYELNVSTSSNVIVIGGGFLSRANDRWKFALKNARTIAFAASESYRSATQTEGGVIITSYYSNDHAEAGRAALIAAAQSLALFNDRFGPYPYSTLNVAENAYFSSATAGGVVLHSGQGYAEYNGRADSLLVATLPQAMARLWWGQVVSGNPFTQPWLNEALPMYAEYIFLESFYPDLQTWYWESRIDYWKPEGLLGRPAVEFKDTEDYLRNLLRRGAQFTHGLRTEIGDDAFFAFLHDFYRNGAYRTVTAADYFNALRRHTDSNLESLLTEYFIGQAMPTPAPTLTPVPTGAPPGPPPPTPIVHVVQAGESLTFIAQQYGVTVDAIVNANQLADPNSIYAGQTLIIPAP